MRLLCSWSREIQRTTSYLPYPIRALPPGWLGSVGWFIHHLLRCLPELSLLHSIAVKNCFTEQAFAIQKWVGSECCHAELPAGFFFPVML